MGLITNGHELIKAHVTAGPIREHGINRAAGGEGFGDL
jgi:hypothetical protein